jgi:O-acetyl-ADP-ribose deacetylase (regulator of RNase III)
LVRKKKEKNLKIKNKKNWIKIFYFKMSVPKESLLPQQVIKKKKIEDPISTNIPNEPDDKTSPFSIKFIKGDILKDCENIAYLAHCISEDCAMGAGIAKDIKYKFTGIRGYTSSKNPVVGNIIPYEFEHLQTCEKTGKKINFNPKRCTTVLNMITKKVYRKPPLKEDFVKTLENLRNYCVENKVKELSMPKIGCGLDRLDFEFVKGKIIELFSDTGVDVVMYVL